MGILAIFLGIVSVTMLFIRSLSIFALIPALIGLILGIIDIILKINNSKNYSFSIIGIVASVVAIIFYGFWLLFFASPAFIENDIMSKAREDMDSYRERANREFVEISNIDTWTNSRLDE